MEVSKRELVYCRCTCEREPEIRVVWTPIRFEFLGNIILLFIETP